MVNNRKECNYIMRINEKSKSWIGGKEKLVKNYFNKGTT